MLDLFFLRHGQAVDIGAPGASTDRKRYLSERGIAIMERAVKGMKRIRGTFDLIVTSPYPRARQTADLVAKAYGLANRLVERPDLAPGADLAIVCEAVEPLEGQGRVLVVGHNPDLEEMVAQCLGMNFAADIKIKKGGLAIVRFEGPPIEGQGELRALLTGKYLGMIGES